MKEFEQEEIDIIESGLGKAYILTEEQVKLLDRLGKRERVQKAEKSQNMQNFTHA